MKKLLVIIGGLFLLTGCTAEYNLTIDNLDDFKEKLTLETTEDNIDYENVKNYYWPHPIDYEVTGYSEVPEEMDGINYYHFNNGTDLNKAWFSYDYDLNKSEFLKSGIIHNCYNKVNLTTTDEGITLRTSENFGCFSKYPPLEMVTVNIMTPLKVISHNADSVNNNIYTFNITKADQNNRSIEMVFENTEVKNAQRESDKLKFIIACLVIGGFLALTFGLIIYKNHKYK